MTDWLFIDCTDFYIGDDAMSSGYAVKYPVRHGLVEDWDLMVRRRPRAAL